MRAAAVVKRASKPSWMARYAIAIARCVFRRPVLPDRIRPRPSVGQEKRAEEGKTQGGLEREVDVVDGLEKGEMRASREPAQACLLPVRDLFRDEDGEVVAAAPPLLFRACGELAPEAARAGEVQTLEQIVDGDLGRVHEKSPG